LQKSHAKSTGKKTGKRHNPDMIIDFRYNLNGPSSLTINFMVSDNEIRKAGDFQFNNRGVESACIQREIFRP